jgi:putative membrane protein
MTLAVTVAIAMAAPGQVPEGDLKFMKEACIGNMSEVMLGKLAQKNGGSKFVVGFGKMMVKDHSTALQQLKQLAKAEKVELPAKVDAKHKALYDKLAKLHGSAFDKAYKHDMILDHREDVAAFNKMSKDAENSNVKNYAARYAPIIEMHLKALATGDLGPMGLGG